jgi:hypothetical protein
MQVTLFPSFGETTAAYHKDVINALDRIKKGKSKDLVEKIRAETDPDAIKALKLGLPCVLFSGTF